MSLANPPAMAPAAGIESPESAGQLLTLVERAAGAGAWALELPGRRMRCSGFLEAMLEMPPHAAPEIAPLLDFFTPESRAIMTAALGACMENGVAFDQEAQLVTARGKHLWVRTVGEAIRDASGAIVRVHGVMQDLTEKKRAEQESLSVTMRLSSTLASISEAFVTLDREGRFTYLNSESERLLGRKSVDLLGQKIWHRLDGTGTGGERLRLEMAGALAQGLTVAFEEFYPQLGKWLELRAHPFDEGIAVYLRDVSTLRQSQEQLLLLQTSISRLNDIVLITEAASIDAPGTRIVFVNDAFEIHTGYSREEVLGKSPRLLQGPQTQRAELDRIRSALQKAQPVRAELINYKKMAIRSGWSWRSCRWIISAAGSRTGCRWGATSPNARPPMMK